MSSLTPLNKFPAERLGEEGKEAEITEIKLITIRVSQKEFYPILRITFKIGNETFTATIESIEVKLIAMNILKRLSNLEASGLRIWW